MELHFINAALPLKSPTKRYELKASKGVWTYIGEQAEAAAEPAPKRTVKLTEADFTGGAEPVVIDLEGRMLLPGFADMHMHLDKAHSIAKVGNRSGTLLEAIQNYGGMAPQFTKAEIKERIKTTALAALSHGTTYIRTHLDFHLAYGKEIAFRTMEAALEAREELKGKVQVQLFPMLPRGQMGDQELAAAAELMKLGMDGLGGAPHLGETPERQIAQVFELAGRYGKPIDLHADESDDPARRTVVTMAKLTAEYGFGGKVTAGHLCSLAAMPPGEAAEIIGMMAEAGVGAVTLPAANMYLQGRDDTGPFRRGVTRVKELLAAGVPVAAASDNIQDPFHPFGRGDLVQIGLLTAYAAHMGAADDMHTLLRMITEIPAALMGLAQYGTEEGAKANFVIVDAQHAAQLFIQESPSRWVAVHGRWVSVSALHRWNAPEA
ncbi:amidohydrolase family protein [Paenibacillus thalictri]|nr:amidohydrolase family protein [Paenibacillus thalictri]